MNTLFEDLNNAFRLDVRASQVISELTYISYASNRDQGMSAEALARLFPSTAAAMEQRYQQEQREAA
jgi:hypothetical protein